MSSKSKGAVAAGHPSTAEAAATILREGGNAFDAVLAALCVAPVAEPVLASLGGGGFLMAKPANGPAQLFDFFPSTPRARRPEEELDFYPVSADFGPAQQEFHIGMGSMAVPGVVRGLFDVHRALCRLPMTRIIEPATRAAREGLAVNALQAYILEICAPIMRATEASRRLTAGPGGELLREGDLHRNAPLADALEALAAEGDDLFYRGEMGARLVADCARDGGLLTAADLEGYRTVRRAPLERAFAGARVLTNPPPSSGGILMAFGLALLEAIDLPDERWGSAAHLGALARVLGLTAKARIETALCEALGNAPGEDDAVARLLAPELVARYREELLGRPSTARGTTHVSVIDADGNMAGLSLSNGEGCGYVLPGTGIHLNNVLGEEDLNPAGFHRWPTACRVASMMAPSLALWPDGRGAVLGSGGSNRIRTALLQVIANLTAFGMSPAEAIAAPRIHTCGELLDIERGYTKDAAGAAAEHATSVLEWTEPNLYFGGVHAVTRAPDGALDGAGDPRRGGVFAQV